MKFLRVIRVDDSDDHVYSQAARPGEWAVVGSFVFSFSDDDPATLSGKPRQAFRNGLLGLESFGWTTLVEIAEIAPHDYEAAVMALARHLVDAYGAPTLEEALPVARQEAEYAAGLCEEAAPGTLLAIERESNAEGIHETFKRIQPSGATQQTADWEGRHGEQIRIWDMLPDS